MKRKIFMVINDIDVDKGGINRVMLSRTKLFTSEKYEPYLVTLNDNMDFKSIEETLKIDGRLEENSAIINIYDFFRQQNDNGEENDTLKASYEKNSKLVEENYNYHAEKDVARYFNNGYYVKFKKWSDAGKLRIVDYFSETRVRTIRENYSEEGYLEKRTTYHPNNNKMTQIHYFTKDGFCYLSRWMDFESGKQTRVYLFERNKQEAQLFLGQEHFYSYFLEQLCKAQKLKPVIICDGPAANPKVKKMAADVAVKIYPIHSTHLSKPYTIGSDTRARVWKVLNNEQDEEAAFVILTNKQKADIEAQFPNKRWNLTVISNPIEPDYYEQPKRQDLAVIVSRFNAEKRLDLVVSAFQQVVQQVPQAQLHIYGEGPEKEAIAELVKQLNLTNSVKLFDYTTEATKKLGEGLFTVISSLYEGQSVAMLEAMSQKTAVLAFDINYIVEEVANNIAGAVVENNSIDALAAKMTEWFKQPEIALALGEKGYETIHSNYAESKLYAQWDALIEKELVRQQQK